MRLVFYGVIDFVTFLAGHSQVLCGNINHVFISNMVNVSNIWNISTNETELGSFQLLEPKVFPRIRIKIFSVPTHKHFVYSNPQCRRLSGESPSRATTVTPFGKVAKATALKFRYRFHGSIHGALTRRSFKTTTLNQNPGKCQ